MLLMIYKEKDSIRTVIFKAGSHLATGPHHPGSLTLLPMHCAVFRIIVRASVVAPRSLWTFMNLSDEVSLSTVHQGATIQGRIPSLT